MSTEKWKFSTVRCAVNSQQGKSPRFDIILLLQIVDTGLVFGLYPTPRITFHSSRLLNRPQEAEIDEQSSPTLNPMDDPMSMATEPTSRRQTMENHRITIATSDTNANPPAQQSFYRRYIASATHTSHVSSIQHQFQNADLSETFSSLDPSTILVRV